MKLLLNQEQRDGVRHNTLSGAQTKLSLTFKRMSRDVYRRDGYFAMKKMQDDFLVAANIALLGVDTSKNKKWWQFFK